MFGRRRHVAAVAAPPSPEPAVPQLAEEQIFEVVHRSLASLIGPRGQWSVTRRNGDDTDAIFHGILTRSTAMQITAQITAAIAAGIVAAEQPEPEIDEPVAFGWKPAPITVWADLRKPVTGEIPQITAAHYPAADREHALVA